MSILGEVFLKRGANLESRAAHTHPKHTQVPPPPRVYGMLRLIEMENIRDLLFPFCATKQAEPDHCGCNFLIM